MLPTGHFQRFYTAALAHPPSDSRCCKSEHASSLAPLPEPLDLYSDVVAAHNCTPGQLLRLELAWYAFLYTVP